ncbi:carbohydrate porin [Methylosinus sp. LW3]|uniref:carbohydrate porin n=1 Tax=Methylosinus sp. LW3 TaxID=107635 RepID=UPI0004670BC3|nr:carbohydrate porin [Methylosinus sp. LW3]
MRYSTAGIVITAMLSAVGPAGAADARTSVPPAFCWAGFYFGVSLGAGVPLHRTERFRSVSAFDSILFDLYPQGRERPGPTFGAQAGYNWQYGNWVYGIETELSFLDGRRGPIGAFPAPPVYWLRGVGSYTLTADPSGAYFGSLRGRLGFAVDRMLFYATGGVASGGWRGASTLTLNGGAPGNVFTSGLSASSRTKYLFGAGVEYALASNWSARAEYLFLNQSHNSEVFDNGSAFDYASQRWAESHILRFGMSYRFGDMNLTAEPDEHSISADERDDPKANKKSKKKSAGSEREKDEKPADTPEQYSVHGQITGVVQGYPKFRALYSGTNSLAPSGGQARATVSATAFLGLRLWQGGEVYVDPEIDEGYGLSSTLGIAGFPSAEAYKVGHARPYLRFQKYFLRQTIGLGGESEKIEAGQNQLANSVDTNRLTLTIGKYSVVDIFDDNKYAHDGRSGFLNWSVLDMGAFDYAADSWGYTHGATAEWKQDWWTARAGVFQTSLIPNGEPNGEAIEPALFRQFMPVVEFEARHSLLLGQEAKIKFLGYGDLAYLGKYDEAVALGLLSGNTPDITADRKKRFKAGAGLNIEQPLADDLGLFLRASMANGRYESMEFTEIERSLSAGAVLTGGGWGRSKDAIGVAGVVNGISGSHIRYLANGGSGILLGDGALTYDGEHILETYYKFNIQDGVHLTANYQFVHNPAYNRDRGSVSIFAVRLHGEF